nr:P1 protein [Wheat leaf yellowing-associated virus]
MARFTNGVWLCALICALLFQSYSCLEQPSTLSLYQQMGYSGSPSTYGWLDSNNITELLADVEGASFTINSPIDPLNLTYGELFGHLSYKVSNDLKELRKEVSNLLRQYSTSTFCLMSEYTKSFVESLLWTIIKLYLSSLGMMIYLMGMILRTTLWKPVLVCAFLAVVSTMTYWMLKKICSYIPLWWVGAPLIAPFMIIRWLASRLIRFVFGESSGDEKMVAGFKSFSVAMSPPGNSILEILHANDSHMGYATCVKLVNGEDALLTATHCCGPDMKIRSLRNGYKIPMREFQIMFTSQELDITILRGPPEWKSLLGAKAVSFTPVNQLNKGPVSLYTYEDGWLMHNAKVVGSDKKYASVLSNTEKGYSGTPYWNGKTVIGVHKGFNYGDSSKNYNLMAPIPPIKGLTAPAYVYESPALQGDAFSEQEIEEIADHAAEIYEKATSAYTWKPRDGKHWWEMVEEEEEFEAASNPSSLPIQGNDQRGADHVEKPESTLAKPDDSTEMLKEIVAQLVKNIDMTSITKRVEEKLLSQAQNSHQELKGRKKSQNTQKTSKNSSKLPTTGKKENATSQGSGVQAASQRYTIPQNRKAKNGGSASSQSTQKWRPKSPASGGQSSAHKPNRQV